MKYNALLMFSAIAALMLIGITSVPQNAYAGFEEENAIWCEVDGEWESGEGFWKKGGDSSFFAEGECIIILDFEEIEVDVEIEGSFLVEETEGDCKDVETELTIFIDDEGFEGTIEAIAEGEICRNHFTVTDQDLEIIGGTGDFDFIIGGEGTFTSDMHNRGGDFEAEIHSSLEISEEEAEHGQVVEVHCDVSYEWEMFLIFGERFGYGECVYIYEDEFEQEEEVHVGGEFVTGFSGQPRPISGGFHMEDGVGNTLWLDEEGTIEFPCSRDTEEEEAIPYCLDTEVTVIEGEGIFSFLTGEGTRTADGYIEHLGIFSDGFAYSTIWIFFDVEVEEEEEVVDKDGGGSCTNCEPPTLGLNKYGDKRMVDNGFGCGSQVVDVGHYYTDFPLITAAVGEQLQCQFKIYEDTHPDNIRHFEFAVGKRVGDSMSDVQGKITWDRDFKLVETVTYDENMFRDVEFFVSKAKCREDSANFSCLYLIMTATPKQPLVDDLIVKTNVWDERRNAKQNFYNDGIDFIGFTENSLPTYNVVDGRNGAITIYTTDPTLEDLTHAIDQNGNTWTLINSIWVKDYVAHDLSCNISSYIGYDRTCPEFSLLKIGQADMALDYFDSSKIQSVPDEPFAYVYPESRDRLTGTLLG